MDMLLLILLLKPGGGRVPLDQVSDVESEVGFAVDQAPLLIDVPHSRLSMPPRPELQCFGKGRQLLE